jgi:hypothetical protein
MPSSLATNPSLFFYISSLCLACIAYSSFAGEVGVEPKIIRKQKNLIFMPKINHDMIVNKMV